MAEGEWEDDAVVRDDAVAVVDAEEEAVDDAEWEDDAVDDAEWEDDAVDEAEWEDDAVVNGDAVVEDNAVSVS